jgi:hypothetical protein
VVADNYDLLAHNQRMTMNQSCEPLASTPFTAPVLIRQSGAIDMNQGNNLQKIGLPLPPHKYLFSAGFFADNFRAPLSPNRF